MMNENVIRLLGQPVKITIPGEECGKFQSTHIHRKEPELICGYTYDGYAMCDLYGYTVSKHDVYIEVDNILYPIINWSCFTYPLTQCIKETQEQVTFNKVKKIALLLYDKLNEIEGELSNKVDRE